MTAESTKTEYKSVVLHSKRGSRNLYLVVGSQGEEERGYIARRGRWPGEGEGVGREGGSRYSVYHSFLFYFISFYFLFLWFVCFLLYQMKDC